MPFFEYRARNAQGQPVNGRLEAASRDTLASQLMRDGITPLAIEPVANFAKIDLGRWFGGTRVSAEGLVMFSRQMHTIDKAAIPLNAALLGPA